MSKSNLASEEMDILVVEDDNMLNQVMVLQVELLGYSVRSAKNGAQALQMIEDRVPSVLILDVGLPDMTGQQLVAKLRQNSSTSSIPLIVHTTLDLSHEEERQLQLGPSRFVTKTTAFSERLGKLIVELTALAAH
jgi:CheY-like chemotaxis protein